MKALAALSPFGFATEAPASRGVDALVRRAQAGDVAAFEELYRAHVGRIHALCSRLCGSSELARSFTQDAFVRAWEKLASFRGDAAFLTWMHRLAVNLVLQDRRTRLRRALREQHVGDELDEATPHSAADASMDLERAIALLPPGARAVFVLHAIEGYRHDQIADMLRLSVGTSKAQLHRAKALLRKALA